LTSPGNILVRREGTLRAYYGRYVGHTVAELCIGRPLADSLLDEKSHDSLLSVRIPTSDVLPFELAEGGAYIDFDQQQLLFFGGELLGEFAARRLWMQMAAVGWRNWTIQAADYGMSELARAAGLQERYIDDVGLPTDVISKLEPGVFPVTVTDGTNATDYLINAPPEDMLGHGPAAFEYMIATLQPVDVTLMPAHLPQTHDIDSTDCLLVDQKLRTVHLSDCWKHDPRVIARIQARWDDWTIIPHRYGLAYHQFRLNRSWQSLLREEYVLFGYLQDSVRSYQENPAVFAARKRELQQGGFDIWSHHNLFIDVVRILSI
jgi:hypothetical protein